MADDIKIVGLSSKKTGGTNWKVISAIVGIVVLSIGVIAGILLVRQNQNIEEKAACAAQCPASNGNLINCYNTADTDGEVSTCNAAGRVEVCGQNASSAKQYCCPSAGAAWTTNLSLCDIAPTATATASATATSTALATATASATATSTSSGGTPTATSTSKGTSTAKATTTAKATSTTKATGSATAFPVPETGADLPTVLGFGFGIVMVLISLALAL